MSGEKPTAMEDPVAVADALMEALSAMSISGQRQLITITARHGRLTSEVIEAMDIRATSERAMSIHSEHPRDGTSFCGVCGDVADQQNTMIDLFRHPAVLGSMFGELNPTRRS